MFRKYDEEMLFFDRITAQKLSETESLRSIKVHPRSISERIVHKLSIKPTNHTLGGRRDPYGELESAYVAQICLTWEALNWNYTNFRQKNSSCNIIEGSGCPARVAQQFQQFQVLLQRFIENEPYEYGRRPEVYARRRISSPNLLQVPEFRDSEGDEGKEDASSNISSDEFGVILEDAIGTFMNFLKADKEKCADKVRAFIKRRRSSPDPVFHQFLKKASKKKKLKLCNIIGKRRGCLRRRKLKHEEEMEVLMGLIDLKVVSRVLRMTQISTEQLHWCEEKMSKVRVWDGKMQRDSSPLFLPVHS
ncbi:uncharacterized protein M6B38_197455 [Iris pallida]|uniref:Uncharacterized protein n=1 Tax=Iris pallida TaxID=29817 RepID=A0AAX6EBJ7_IRIPA|nr:uncharacterized protein M6B38_197455 [Iris pallida]